MGDGFRLLYRLSLPGSSKTLKTSLSIDLGISLASGLPFLGRFQVPRPARVAFVSGESGGGTVQETARRICKAKGITFAGLADRLSWSFDLPTLTDLSGVVEFAKTLAELRAEVVFIDPLYLCLGDADSKNLFEMGQALRSVSEILLKAGSTPIILHHANRSLAVGEPMKLQHLSYSGVEQYARQFLLLNRRESYRSDGVHDLWMRVGGSAGHGGLWGVHIREGIVDDQFAGRVWDVETESAGEASQNERDRKDQAKDEAARSRRRVDLIPPEHSAGITTASASGERRPGGLSDAIPRSSRRIAERSSTSAGPLSSSSSDLTH